MAENNILTDENEHLVIVPYTFSSDETSCFLTFLAFPTYNDKTENKQSENEQSKEKLSFLDLLRQATELSLGVCLTISPYPEDKENPLVNKQNDCQGRFIENYSWAEYTDNCQYKEAYPPECEPELSSLSNDSTDVYIPVDCPDDGYIFLDIDMDFTLEEIPNIIDIIEDTTFQEVPDSGYFYSSFTPIHLLTIIVNSYSNFIPIHPSVNTNLETVSQETIQFGQASPIDATSITFNNINEFPEILQKFDKICSKDGFIVGIASNQSINIPIYDINHTQQVQHTDESHHEDHSKHKLDISSSEPIVHWKGNSIIDHIIPNHLDLSHVHFRLW